MTIYNHTNHFTPLPQLNLGNTFLPSLSNQNLFPGNLESMDEIETDIPLILDPEIQECQEAFDRLEKCEWEVTDWCKGQRENHSLGGAIALKEMLVQMSEVNDLVEDLPKNVSFPPVLNRSSEECATVASIVEMWSEDVSEEIDTHLRHINRLKSYPPLAAHAMPLCLALKKQLEQVILTCKQSKAILLRESKQASKQKDKNSYLAAACELKEVIKKAKHALTKCTEELKGKDLSTIANVTYGDEEWEHLSSIEPPESLKRKFWNKTTSFLNPLGYIPEKWRPSTQQIKGAFLIALVGGEHAINRVEKFYASPYLSTSSASSTNDGIIPAFFKYISSFWKVANNDPKTIIEEAHEELKQATKETTINKFKEEVAFLRRQVLLAVADTPNEDCPVFELFSWKQHVDELCYDLKVLESRVADVAPAASALMSQEIEEVRALFGNKHTNLLKLSTLFTTLETPGVVVPLPQGISSDQVHGFLVKRSPQIFEDWSQLGRLYANYQGREAFLQTEEALTLLTSMNATIVKAFEASEEDSRELFTEEFMLWIEGIAARGEYLMVRSTGAEDSAITNAGKHVSKAYVNPNFKDTIKATGEVIRSYLSPDSLQNRINFNENPFAEKLQFSVTAQELIGEPVGGAPLSTDIPVSMVIFSNEPLFVAAEEFRLMRITAAPGHGEAVVNNLGIATDSILVIQSVAHPDKLYILYDNQLKPLRMAPVAVNETVILEKFPNAPETAATPALSYEMIARLYHVGLTVEKYFGHRASDLEIVVKKGKIHIVQARPVNRPSLLPTYLDIKKTESLPQSPVIKKIQGEIIVPGKTSTITITDKSQMIVANTLEEAEHLYLASPPGSVKLVVVGTEEPANSHPVVNFSSQGIPCLLMKNHQEAKSFADQISATHQVVACVQTATLNLWNLEVAEPQNYLSEGFAVHPAKIALSLPVAAAVLYPSIIEEEAPAEIKDLLIQVRSQDKKEAIQALNTLEKHPWVTQLGPRIASLTDQLAATHVEGGLPLLAVLESIERQRVQAFEEARLTLNSDKRLHPLFWQKTLEAALIGNQRSLGLGQQGLVHAKSLANSLQILIDYQKQLNHPAHLISILLDGMQQAPFAGIANEWKRFLLNLEWSVNDRSIPETDINEFKELIFILKQANVLSTWLLITFQPKVNKATSKSNLKAFIAEFSTEEKTKLKTMLNEQRIIREQMAQIEQFADPQLFPKALEQLKETVKHFSSSTIVQNLDESSSIIRMVSLQSMEQLIAFGDAAIKSMKKGQAFEEPKAKIFKEMIGLYFDILNDWEGEDTNTWRKMHYNALIRSDRNKGMLGYLYTIKNIFNRLNDDPSQLLPSMDFSVSAAVFGSNTLFERHLPKTLEDVFTLVHQNLIKFVEWESKKSLSDISWNPRLKDILEINALKDKEISGINIDGKGVTIRYNFPLRNHSAHLEIRYDKATDRIIFTYSFLGEARARWDTMTVWINLLDEFDHLKMADPIKQTNQEITFSWNIPNKQAAINAMDKYEKCVQVSYDTVFIDQLKTLIPNIDVNALATRLINTAIRFSDVQPVTTAMLFRTLVASGYSIAEAEAAADKLLNLSPQAVLKLLIVLVMKGHAFAKAEAAAIQYLETYSLETAAIFEQLIKKKYLTPAAVETNVIKLFSSNLQIGIRLMDVLISLGHPIKAIEATIIERLDKHSEQGLEALKVLMSHGYGHLAPQIGTIAMKSLEDGHHDFAVKLFNELISHGLELKLAEDAINKLLDLHQQLALELFHHLAQKTTISQATRNAVARKQYARRGVAAGAWI